MALSAPPAREQAVSELWRSFKEATGAVRRLRARDAHRTGELSHVQYSVLFELLSREEVSAGELAVLAGVSAASMTEMLDRLERAGLVERARSPRDRRVVVCQITDGGRRRCEERRAELEPLVVRALAAHSDEELRVAAAVLDSLRGFYDGITERDAGTGAGPDA